MKNVRAVVLAAGEGTRMKSPLTKLLHRIDYQELVKFPVGACVKSGVSKVIVVVGHQAEKVKSVLGNNFEYVYQKERRGTGDALKQAIPLLKDFGGELIVLPGDAPFVTPSILKELVQYQRKRESAATVLTALLPNPTHYGRIVRDGYRQIKKIVEIKDATSEELKIKEVNSGIYCFNTRELLPVLPLLKCNNASREYYLTDVVELFHQKGLRVEAMRTKDSLVVLGVNTPEELKRAWKILKRKSNK
ncbi:NTP transferase domain-containing protein [Candidatus Aerophobetes bacterium]|nr:NTP transferase domain-containing protein [Candidatus Aerophobetes bacterium]